MSRRRDEHDPHHPTAPPAEDGRDPRDLTPAENADLCAGCVRCCTYITVEIDAPRAAWEYDQWIWALHHDAIQIYVERPERWFLHVETRCRQLRDDGRCAIHGRHPVLCREYDPRSCERRLPLADIRAWFHDADQLEAWMRAERPAHWRRLMAHRKDRPDAPPMSEAAVARARHGRGALIPVEALVGMAATGPASHAPPELFARPAERRAAKRLR
jgi:hypothetical protein